MLDPIWFFDGTGQINKKLPDQNDSHFFSVIAHDSSNEKFIPVFEFVSTDHTASQLSYYLEKGMISLESAKGITKNQILVPPIIVKINLLKVELKQRGVCYDISNINTDQTNEKKKFWLENATKTNEQKPQKDCPFLIYFQKKN